MSHLHGIIKYIYIYISVCVLFNNIYIYILLYRRYKQFSNLLEEKCENREKKLGDKLQKQMNKQTNNIIPLSGLKKMNDSITKLISSRKTSVFQQSACCERHDLFFFLLLSFLPILSPLFLF